MLEWRVRALPMVMSEEDWGHAWRVRKRRSVPSTQDLFVAIFYLLNKIRKRTGDIFSNVMNCERYVTGRGLQLICKLLAYFQK